VSKRGQNEGSIYKRQDGRWAASLNLGYKNGKRHRKHFYGWTRKEVQDKLTEALRAHQQGLIIPDERQTVGQFLTCWLADTAKPSVRPLTYETYEAIVRRHIEPEVGRITLSKLTPQDVQRLLNNKLESGLSPRRVRHIHSVLRNALGQAHRWGMVARNVATLVSPPSVKRSEIQPFSPEQARAFLQATKGDRLEALYSVALAVGLRRGEALGLRWQDVDLERGTLTVNKSLQRIGSKLTLVEPKTAGSRRTIVLPEVALTALKAHRARQNEERLKMGPLWQENKLVFTTTVGTPLEAGNVARRNFKKLLRSADLPDIRFHDLRHTAATLLLAQGIHPRVVMEILGHSQISLTMNTYSHVLPTLQHEAASKIDAILND